jgi:hypothetical protein
MLKLIVSDEKEKNFTYTGTLLFPTPEYKAFMTGSLAVGYDPLRHNFEGKELIVVNAEIELAMDFNRYLVRKKIG